VVSTARCSDIGVVLTLVGVLKRYSVLRLVEGAHNGLGYELRPAFEELELAADTFVLNGKEVKACQTHFSLPNGILTLLPLEPYASCSSTRILD